MKKKFVSNLVFLLALNLPIKVFWILVIDRTAYNTLGQEAYGEYAALLSFSALLHIFLDFGIANFNNKAISQNPNLINKYYPSLLLIKALLAGLYFGIIGIAAHILGYSENAMELLWILAFNQFLSLYIYFNKSNLAGLQKFKIDSIVSVLDRGISILLLIFVLLIPILPVEFSSKNFILFQTAGYIFSAIVSTILVLIHLNYKKLELRLTEAKSIIKDALPFSLLALIMMLYTRSDIVMINKLLGNQGDTEAGIYAGAYRLLDAGAMFCFLFSSLLLPIFSRMLAKKEDVRPIITFTTKSLIIPVFIGSILASFNSIFLMNSLYKEAETQMYTTFTVLILSFIPFASQYVFGTLLTASNHLKFINITSIIGLLLNILINYILIPIYGAVGAAIATLLTQFLVNGLQFLKAYKEHQLNISTVQFFKFAGLIITTIITGYILSLRILNPWIFIPLFTGLNFLVAFILGLFDIKSFLSLMAFKKEA